MSTCRASVGRRGTTTARPLRAISTFRTSRRMPLQPVRPEAARQHRVHRAQAGRPAHRHRVPDASPQRVDRRVQVGDPHRDAQRHVVRPERVATPPRPARSRRPPRRAPSAPASCSTLADGHARSGRPRAARRPSRAAARRRGPSRGAGRSTSIRARLEIVAQRLLDQVVHLQRGGHRHGDPAAGGGQRLQPDSGRDDHAVDVGDAGAPVLAVGLSRPRPSRPRS